MRQVAWLARRLEPVAAGYEAPIERWRLRALQNRARPVSALLRWLRTLDLDSRDMLAITTRWGVRADGLHELYLQTGASLSRQKFAEEMLRHLSDPSTHSWQNVRSKLVSCTASKTALWRRLCLCQARQLHQVHQVRQVRQSTRKCKNRPCKPQRRRCDQHNNGSLKLLPGMAQPSRETSALRRCPRSTSSS